MLASSFIHRGGGRLLVSFGSALRAAAVALAATMLGACGGGAGSLPTFDLYAPRNVGPTGTAYTQLTVNEPIVVQAFDSDRVVVKDQGGTISYLGGAQWVDKLPRLFQTRTHPDVRERQAHRCRSPRGRHHRQHVAGHRDPRLPDRGGERRSAGGSLCQAGHRLWSGERGARVHGARAGRLRRRGCCRPCPRPGLLASHG